MKKKVILILFIVVIICSSFDINSFGSQEDSKWYTQYVEELQKRDIFSAFQHEKFDPDRIVARQDIIKMIIMSQDYRDSLGSPTNIPSNSYNSYIYITNRAVEMGIIERQQVLSIFNPYDFISREEAVELIIKALHYFVDTPNSNTVKTVFKDSYDVSHSRVSYFNRAISIGMVKGYSDNTFRPKNYITMSESAAMVWRIIDNIETHFFSIENSIYINSRDKHINISINEEEKSIKNKLGHPSWEHDNGTVKWKTYMINQKEFVLMAIKEGLVVYLYSNSRNWKDSNEIYSGMELEDLLQGLRTGIVEGMVSKSSEDIIVNYYIDYQHVPKINSVEIYKTAFYNTLYHSDDKQYYSNIFEDITFLVINSFRLRDGVEGLNRDEDIGRIAREYSEIRGIYPQASIIWELQGGSAHWLNANDISYWGVAESIMEGKYLPVKTVELWLDSINSRLSILNKSFSKGGVGVFLNEEEGIIYYSLIQVMPPFEH